MIRSEYRVCMVNGQKALFHGWSNESTLLINYKEKLSHSDKYIAKLFLEEFRNSPDSVKVLPYEFEVVTTHNKFGGIVEFEDGTIKMVQPTDITFLDSEGIFSEYDFGGMDNG